MTYKSFITTILIAGAAVTATSALAMNPGHGPRGPEMNFESLDADGNGEITPEEMRASMTSRFMEADADGDGKLSKEEMIAQGQARIEKNVSSMIERLDKDGDGAISAEELPKPDDRRGAKMFERVDTDKSGGISAEEFAEMKSRMDQHRKDRGDKKEPKN